MRYPTDVRSIRRSPAVRPYAALCGIQSVTEVWCQGPECEEVLWQLREQKVALTVASSLPSREMPGISVPCRVLQAEDHGPTRKAERGDKDRLIRDVEVWWFRNGGDAPRNTLSSRGARLAAGPPPGLSFILQVTDMWVYINYPNPHFTLHRDESCGMIQMHHKPNQRVRSVSISSLGDFLSEFIDEKMRFGSQSTLDDVWIKMELDTPEQEIGLVHVVQALLGRRYTPLSDAPVGTHC